MDVLIIGAGDVAYSHGRAAVKLGGKVIGAYDVNREGLKKFAREFDCAQLSYDELDEYIKKADYAVICTPPTKRLDYVEKVLSAHVPLYMEKPVAATMADAEKLEELARRYNGRIIVGFAHRYRPAFVKMHELVSSGMFGEPVNVFSYRIGPGYGYGQRSLGESWRTDPQYACGMTIESISHEFNLLTALCGDFSTLSANVWNTVEAVPQYDTNVAMTMKIARGGVASISASWSSAVGNNLKGYVGTRGSILLKGRNMFEFDELVYKTVDMEHEECIHYYDSYDMDQDGVIFHIHKYFQSCLASGSEIITPLAEGIKVLKLSMAALESSRESREIIF